jgi:hypothetical protein
LKGAMRSIDIVHCVAVGAGMLTWYSPIPDSEMSPCPTPAR